MVTKAEQLLMDETEAGNETLMSWWAVCSPVERSTPLAENFIVEVVQCRRILCEKWSMQRLKVWDT